MSAISHGTRAGICRGTRAMSVVMSRSDSFSGSGPYLLTIGAFFRDAREVGRTRAGALFREQCVVALARTLFPNCAFLVGEIAEGDRLCGAGLLAGGHGFAVAHRAVLDVGLDRRRFYPLDAVGAFLHHAAAANGDVRVARRLGGAGRVGGVIEPVKPPHLVWAVARAGPRPDAAVVDHQVQPLGAVDRRMDRAAHLARRL